MIEKKCARCLETKPADAFSACRGRLHSYCKPCRVRVEIEYRAHRNEKARVARRSRHERPQYYADSMMGRRYKSFQTMLNAVPAFSRGNLAPVVRSFVAEAA